VSLFKYRPLDNPKFAALKKDKVDDEDSSDGGFKQRISSSRPVARTVKGVENSSNFTINPQLQSRQSLQQRVRLEKTSSSFDNDDRSAESPVKRPTHLYFANNRVRFWT